MLSPVASSTLGASFVSLFSASMNILSKSPGHCREIISIQGKNPHTTVCPEAYLLHSQASSIEQPLRILKLNWTVMLNSRLKKGGEGVFGGASSFQ